MLTFFYIDYASGEAERRKDFFEIFAKTNNFDPLVAENWYKYSLSDILKAVSTLFFYLLYKK